MRRSQIYSNLYCLLGPLRSGGGGGGDDDDDDDVMLGYKRIGPIFNRSSFSVLFCFLTYFILTSMGSSIIFGPTKHCQL
jgi:hypothetical protein